MRKIPKIMLAAGSVLLLAACATTPVGPMVRVLPAPYKPFEVFQRDHFECEQWADSQVAGTRRSREQSRRRLRDHWHGARRGSRRSSRRR